MRVWLLSTAGATRFDPGVSPFKTCLRTACAAMLLLALTKSGIGNCTLDCPAKK